MKALVSHGVWRTNLVITLACETLEKHQPRLNLLPGPYRESSFVVGLATGRKGLGNPSISMIYCIAFYVSYSGIVSSSLRESGRWFRCGFWAA